MTKMLPQEAKNNPLTWIAGAVVSTLMTGSIVIDSGTEDKHEKDMKEYISLYVENQIQKKGCQ